MADDIVLAGESHRRRTDATGWEYALRVGEIEHWLAIPNKSALADALDEIERLRAENEALRAALAIKDNHDHFDCTAEREVLRLENQRLQALIDALAIANDSELRSWWDDAIDALLAAATKKEDDRG